MPSPIAHCSLLLALVPSLRGRLSTLTRVQRWCFYAAVLFALMAPDLDIMLGLLLGRGPFELHGGPTHSLVLAPLFGLMWAAAVRLWLKGPVRAWGWGLLWVIGTGAYALHVLLDLLTPGRGVGLWWPFNEARVGSPIYLFVGVEHSNWKDLPHHGLTLVTEAGFALAMAGLGWALGRVRAKRGSVVEQSAEAVA